jgi:hypothetical protein
LFPPNTTTSHYLLHRPRLYFSAASQDIKASVLEAFKAHRAQVAMIGDYGSCKTNYEGYKWTVDWGDDNGECRAQHSALHPCLASAAPTVAPPSVTLVLLCACHSRLQLHFTRAHNDLTKFYPLHSISSLDPAAQELKVGTMQPYQAVHTYAKKGKYQVEVSLCATKKGCEQGCKTASKLVAVKP